MPGKRTAAGYEVVSTDGLGLGAEADEQEPLRQQLPAAAAARPSVPEKALLACSLNPAHAVTQRTC
jgi:hypothetical protein